MPATAAKGEGVPTPERDAAEPSDRIRGVSEKPKSYQAIMVSSTFTDLKHHRQQVIRAIEALGYRANVMEHDGARADADVIDSSLQFVRDSAAYVGVISRKYGQTPYCPQRNPDRLSITELEFNEAMRLRRPILLFIMSEKHQVSEADIELDRDRRQKLDAFRQRARRMREGSEVERVYQVFDSLDQFSTAAFAAIGRLAEYLRRDHARDQRSEPEKSEQIPGAERGPAGKNEPPTRIVDALHRGDHASLTDALKAAEPGDRILIRPGLYREGVAIDKPVEIIGDGELGEVVIEANGKDAVLFQANMARIANLTLRQTGGGDWYCVDIAQGRLDLEGCDITSQSLACVAIHDGADPRLRRNRIRDGKASGVFAYENGQGTLEDNDIFANATAGVAIREGGTPTLRRNRISGNGREAIWVHDGGGGVFEDNDLRGNTKGAWDIAKDCEDKVTRKGNQE